MPSLSYLDISGCPKLNSVPAGSLHYLTGLRSLQMGPFSDLVDIFNGIQQLSSLGILWVHGHAHQDSLPHQLMELSSLLHIRIYEFGIVAFPRRISNLTSLETLGLVRCKQLQHMDFLDAMPKLRHLEIRDCPLLEALSDGLVNLISLQQLTLSNCKKLEHLPSRDAMRRLTKLQCLEVRRCSKLEESCTNQSGPNSQWSKISHIPVIKVGERTIQNLDLGLNPLVEVFSGLVVCSSVQESCN